ncbi:MAG: hypothetical protein EAX96_03350 [Candidatus Lokiarchaeota archaeon]|nr:hypothetical protein [Candidatus Lokiarchaeota archaeon]
MRFCNTCGSIIIGLKCTNCFGMDLSSTRSRLLNKELFSTVHQQNALLTKELPLEKKISSPLTPMSLDISKKLSENRMNAIKNEIELPNVVENLSNSTHLGDKRPKTILIEQDPITKSRNEWADSVKQDVNFINLDDVKEKYIEKDKNIPKKVIPENEKFNID